jgi:hypothetical protein
MNAKNHSALLQQQKATQEQINKLLETSANALMCGPECQKQKKTDKLRQQYLDAQTNIKMAPSKLEETKKNYYVYSQGETYYDNMQETELTKKAEELGNLLSISFNSELNDAKTMNSYLNTAQINSSHTLELLTYYKSNNKEIERQLKESSGDILTNDRKTYYETDAITRLKQWHSFFWYIYYLLVLVLNIAIFISPSELSTSKKFALLTLFTVYPYYISTLTNWVYDNVVNIQKNMPKNVYNNL